MPGAMPKRRDVQRRAGMPRPAPNKRNGHSYDCLYSCVPTGPTRSISAFHCTYSDTSRAIRARKSVTSLRVTSPTMPDPIVLSSIFVTGITSAALPVRKHSSAV